MGEALGGRGLIRVVVGAGGQQRRPVQSGFEAVQRDIFKVKTFASTKRIHLANRCSLILQKQDRFRSHRFEPRVLQESRNVDLMHAHLVEEVVNRKLVWQAGVRFSVGRILKRLLKDTVEGR